MKKINEYQPLENGALEHVNVWILNRWYEKVAFVLGVIYSLCFIVGFIVGFVSSINV